MIYKLSTESPLGYIDRTLRSMNILNNSNKFQIF